MTAPAWPEAPRKVVVELFVGGRWVEVSSDVLQRDDILIRRGYSSEGNSLVASTATLTFDNDSGDYAPDNPHGQWYGTLGRNTPLRVSIGELAVDEFDRTVSNGWGTSTSGSPWALVGASSSFAVAAGAGTHAFSGTGTYRITYLDGPVWSDVEAVVTVGMSVGDVTGAEVEPANLLFRGLSVSDQGYLLRLRVMPDQSVSAAWRDASTGLTVGETVTVPGLTYGTGVQLRVRAHVDGLALRAKVWNAAGGEPLRWHLTDSVEPAGVQRTVRQGWVGIRSGVASGNTNGGTITFTYSDFELLAPRAYGEVADWPQSWDTSGNDAYVQAEAAGILRRYSQGQAALESTMRRKLTRDTDNPPIVYWPCEDESKSTSLASALGGDPLTMKYGPSTLSTSDIFDCSAPLPELRNGEWSAKIPAAPYTGAAQWRFLLHCPPADEAATGQALVQVRTTGPTAWWDLQYDTGGTLRLRAYDGDRTELFDSGPVGFDLRDRPVRVSLEINALSATSVHWAIATIEPDGTAGGLDGNQSGLTLGSETQVLVNPGGGYEEVVLGHLSLQHQITSIFTDYAELAAHTGETARARMARLCAEEGVPFTWYRGNDASSRMGPQRRETLLRLLQDAADVDQGLLYEPRGDLGLEYRNRNSLYLQDPALTLDLAAGHLQPGFRPVTDDRITRNDWTVTRHGGSSARYVLEDGPMSVRSADEGGVGLYDDSLTVAAYTDDDLPSHASWRVLLGTRPEARFPSIPLTLTNRDIDEASALSLDVGDVLAVDNAAALRIYDQVRQVVRGYRETLNAFVHKLDYVGLPASPYDVLQLDDQESKLDTAGSVLTAAVLAASTAFDVATTAGPPWITTTRFPTQFPVRVRMGGEVLTLDSVANNTITYVGAGTAAHADNAAVTPTLPGGYQAGDLLLVLASARDAAVPINPNGYNVIHINEGLRLFARIATSSEVNPQVGVAGGAAGATVSAQCAAFRGKFHRADRVLADPTMERGQLNASGQNIAYPGIEVEIDNCLILYLGSKADDWTSVTSPGTEIGEPSSTTGSDQGLVWSYQIQTTRSDITAGSFTVTGGAAAISHGSVVALRSDVQSVTATRALNGVSKDHAAGTTLALDRRATVPL